jgi:hypothetical protein
VTLENCSATPEEIKATLGLAKNVTITKDDTILLNGNGSKYFWLYAGPTSKAGLTSSANRSRSPRVPTTRRNSRRG